MKHTLLLVVVFGTGCFNAGMQPRTADLVSKGQVTMGLDNSIYTMAPGEVTQTGQTFGGVYGMRQMPHPMMSFMILPYLNGVGHLRVGASDRVELGGMVGIQESGLEARVALSDEDRGAPVSMAANASVLYRPLDLFEWSKTPGGRIGFEISKRADKTTPFANVSVSYAEEMYARLLPAAVNQDCGGFGEEGCSEYGPPRQWVVRRNEVRVTGALGLAFESPNDKRGSRTDSFQFSVVPYVTLWSGAEDLSCLGCSFATPDAFDSRMGITVTGGYRFR